LIKYRGKVFGGFTDVDWSCNSGYIQSDNHFLFSVTLRDKFLVKNDRRQYATYVNSNCGPTFGGHDLYISDNCDHVNCRTEFGHSYDTNVRGKDDLTGAHNFRVKEIEVFHVEVFENIRYSRIIKDIQDIQMLEKWISNNDVSLKLLYRGTRDGFATKAFHDKVGQCKQTITLIHTSSDKICGGYSDVDWSGNHGSYCATENSFLFSITLRDKFPVKNDQKQYAIYASSGYGPTFGGHDLYVCDNCDASKGSYANFGHSYDTKGRGRDELTGTYNFTVKEIEVYQVLFI